MPAKTYMSAVNTLGLIWIIIGEAIKVPVNALVLFRALI